MNGCLSQNEYERARAALGSTRDHGPPPSTHDPHQGPAGADLSQGGYKAGTMGRVLLTDL
jgi:hypothetical protein